jgi:peptidoglycan LD-endopeptidase LytH
VRRWRRSSAVWTAAVVASATVALLGIALFMAHVHRAWRGSGTSRERVAEAGARASAGDVPLASQPGRAAASDEAMTPSGERGEPDEAARPAGDPAIGLDAPPAPARLPAALVSALRARRLTMPVQGVAPAALVPSFEETRGDRPHEALDIMAPAGTPVVAVEDGTIAKLFPSEAGGLTVYQFDPSRAVAYYYAHLARYAPGLEEGTTVARGQVIGYVGSSGNADPEAPHLHFAIFRLGPERRWWEGTAIDPYHVLR